MGLKKMIMSPQARIKLISWELAILDSIIKCACSDFAWFPAGNRIQHKFRKKRDFLFWSILHTMPSARVQQWQLERLKKLITSVEENVPLYRSLWKGQGLSSSSIKTLDDLRLFPIMNKSIYRSAQVTDTIHSGFEPDKYIWRTTTGSTGEPFRFARKKETLRDYMLLDWFRFLWWRGWGIQELGRMRVAKISNYHTPFFTIPMTLFRDDPKAALQKIIEYRPEAIISRQSMLYEFAKIIEARKSVSFSIPFIITAGDAFREPMRNFIESVLRGEVFDLYGLEEIGNIAVECQEHSGMHISEEGCLIEIVDEKGLPVFDGMRGRIIATALPICPTPFIRYDTGDYGRIIQEPCPCGIPAQRIVVEGRRGDFLNINGLRINTHEIEGIFLKDPGLALQFQIIKRPDQSSVVNLLPIDIRKPPDLDELRERFIQEIGVAPEIRIVDHISSGPGGKILNYVDQTV